MDYSTLSNDPEHPGGPSPWASSPQHNRTSFSQPPTSDIPSSPLPPQASPYGQDSENDQGFMGNHGSHGTSETAVENGQYTQQPRQQSNTSDRPHSAQGQQQQLPPQGQQEQHRHEPQRYHHGARQQRQHQQQYKLQAKVTGLERTGRKDPILRFDVYVCQTNIISRRLHVQCRAVLTLRCVRLIFLNSVRLSSVMYGACTPNS